MNAFLHFQFGRLFHETGLLACTSSAMTFGFDNHIFYITEREVSIYLCKHRGFGLDIDRVEVFKRVQEIDGQGEFESLEASTP